MTDFVLNEFLPYQLAVLSSRVSRAFSETYRKRFGISIPEWRVIAHLSQAGAVSVREIHARVEMDKSKGSRAAARLEAAGYVSKKTHAGDRRLVELSLTDKGRAMIDQLTPMAHAFEAEVLTALGKDASVFRSALERLLRTSVMPERQATDPLAKNWRTP
ncbi:MAG: MarR family winged helix-turn-helix transcriptional regulator [Pseudomonadota bacterium]